MKLYLVEFCFEIIEIAAESEQDAKIMASHCCNKGVKEVISIKYKGETKEPYFKTHKKKICGYCGKYLKEEDIKEYHPNPDGDWNDDLNEQQCPYCGYHSFDIEEKGI